MYESLTPQKFEFYSHRSIPCMQPTLQNKSNTARLLPAVPRLLVHKKSIRASRSLSGHALNTTDMVLNFKRLRFFPLARPHNSGDTMFNTSLGCVSKFLNKGKSFTKKKATFLLVSTLLRRVLMYSGINNVHLYVNNTPLYFQEILNNIHLPTKSVYTHPFLSNHIVDESADNFKSFDFKYVSFTRPKPYGYVK